jgi:hypothetical protein
MIRSISQMNRRSFFGALALFASLAFASPSQAGFIVEVSEHFSIKADLPTTTVTSATLSFSGLNGITDASFSGLAFFLAPSFGNSVVTPTVGPGQTITLTFSPGATQIDGTLKFNTIMPTDNLSTIQSTIFPGGLTYTANGQVSTSTDPLTFRVVGPVVVPEPTSSAMFGIGIMLAAGLGWGSKRRKLAKLAV